MKRIILAFAVLFAAVLLGAAGKANIDFTDTDITGTVKINTITEITDRKIKVSIEKTENKYIYDLKGDKSAEVYPLQWGNGEYTIRVLIQSPDSSSTKYAVALSVKYMLELEDENAPFLNPSQLVNYSSDTYNNDNKNNKNKTVEIADELETIEEIYMFVIQALEYDAEKAESVKSGYLPDIDEIINSGKGICFDYAAVLAAMLRSQGIPAKLVMGYVKIPGSDTPVYHAWNEIYLGETDKTGSKGGWIVLNGMKFEAGRFERVDATFDSANKSSKAVMRHIGDGSNYAKAHEF